MPYYCPSVFRTLSSPCLSVKLLWLAAINFSVEIEPAFLLASNHVSLFGKQHQLSMRLSAQAVLHDEARVQTRGILYQDNKPSPANCAAESQRAVQKMQVSQKGLGPRDPTKIPKRSSPQSGTLGSTATASILPVGSRARGSTSTPRRRSSGSRPTARCRRPSADGEYP